MRAEVVTAEWEHVDPIALNMREADVLECWLIDHKTPLEAVQGGFERSIKAWTIMNDDWPIGMFGVCSISVMGRIGVPWLLGTDGMLKIRRKFVRESYQYLNEVMDLYPSLMNLVHVDNVASLRWLRWLGFDFYGPFRMGPEQAEFFRFERHKDV